MIAKEGETGDLGRLRVPELTWEHCSTTFDTGVLRPPYVHQNDHHFVLNQGEAIRRRKAHPESEGYRCDCQGCGPDLSILDVDVAVLSEETAIPLLYRCCKTLPASNLLRHQLDGHFCTDYGTLKNVR